MSEQWVRFPNEAPSCLFCLGGLVSARAGCKGSPQGVEPVCLPARSKAGRSGMRQAHDVTRGLLCSPTEALGALPPIPKLQPCHSSRGGSRDRAHAGQLRLWGRVCCSSRAKQTARGLMRRS